MPTIILTDAQQRALRSLLAADVVLGAPGLSRDLVAHLATLVPGDGLAEVPCDFDVLDTVALIERRALERRRRDADERDLAVLRMIEPLLQRLLRPPPSPPLPDSLTAQERRVLQLIAAGLTNHEIAEHLGVAPSTVRKHLEHAYPKLGVTNRLAAALAFHGPPSPGPDAPESAGARAPIFA